MALEKITDELDKIEIVGAFKNIQIRSATYIEEDGVMVGSKQYHRRTLSPVSDYTNEPLEVQSLHNVFHTSALIAAFESAQESEVS